MAKVQMACRDCKKCTNSAVANLGRNTGRVMAATFSLGVSELGFLATKQCRQCGHSLSLHGGETVLTEPGKLSDSLPDGDLLGPAATRQAGPAAPAAKGPSLPREHGIAQAAIELSASDLSLNREEISRLPFILDDDEQVVLICIASQQIPNKFLPRRVLVVLTDKFLRLVGDGGSPADTAAIDYRDPSSHLLTYARSMITDSMAIDWPDGTQTRFGTITRNGRNLEAALEKLRNAPPKIEPAPAPEPVTTEAEAAVPAAQDPVALLKGLAELHAAGVLTDDEFAVQKEKLLGQI